MHNLSFLNACVSQGSVPTASQCGGIFYINFSVNLIFFPALEKILKIGQDLAKSLLKCDTTIF